MAISSRAALAAAAQLVVIMLVATSCPGSEAASGKATFYTAPYTPSACFGYDALPSDYNFAAANPSIYASGAACGTHYSIACTGSGCNGGGPITVEIVDLCPGCASDQFVDLSQEAFAKIANLDAGVISITYSQV